MYLSQPVVNISILASLGTFGKATKTRVAYPRTVNTTLFYYLSYILANCYLRYRSYY